MKTTKKLLLVFATLFTMSVFMFGSCITSSAATFPAKVRVFPKSASDVITVKLDTPGDQVINLKGNKNLKAMITSKSIRKDEDIVEENECSIGLYAKKEGKFKLTFDIADASGAVKQSAAITVFSKSDDPVKNITLGGKSLVNMDDYASKKSGKLKVTMNKGYKLSKIEVGKYVRKVDADGSVDTDTTYTEVKNKKKITLGTVPYEYSYTGGDLANSYYYDTYDKGMTAPTYIRITYVDKYTKEETTRSYFLSKLCI